MSYVDATNANVAEAVSASLRTRLESIHEEVQPSNREYSQLSTSIRYLEIEYISNGRTRVKDHKCGCESRFDFLHQTLQ
jgi:hypothetical protein